MKKSEQTLVAMIFSTIIIAFFGSLISGIFALLQHNIMLAVKFHLIAIIIFAGGFIK